MNKKLNVIIAVLILSSIMFSCSENQLNIQNKDNTKVSKLTGPYLGQKPPGSIPEIFAPGIVSSDLHEHSSVAISPNGLEIFWNTVFRDNYIYRFPDKVISVKMEKEIWSNPEFSNYFGKLNSHINASWSPDGKRIYFSSDSGLNSIDTTYGSGDLWYIEMNNDQWSEPVHLDSTINSKHVEGTPYVTENLTLYYMGYLEGVQNNYGIFRSKYINGVYQKPEPLPIQINSKELDWTPFIAPDESYILFSSFREGGYGRGDLYVSYRTKNDNWSEAINLGNKINLEYNERFPYVSPDGKYLFFLTDKVDEKLLKNKNLSYSEAIEKYYKPGNGWCDIYWVDAKVIEELRPDK